MESAQDSLPSRREALPDEPGPSKRQCVRPDLRDRTQRNNLEDLNTKRKILIKNAETRDDQFIPPQVSPASSTTSTSSMKQPTDSTDTPPGHSDTTSQRRQRYLRTFSLLQDSGLLGVYAKTAELITNGKKIDIEIESLKEQTAALIQSILVNPENRHLHSSYNASTENATKTSVPPAIAAEQHNAKLRIDDQAHGCPDDNVNHEFQD